MLFHDFAYFYLKYTNIIPLCLTLYGINFRCQQHDNNMLCKVEVNTDCVPTNYMDNFGGCIIKLMNNKKMKKYA